MQNTKTTKKVTQTPQNPIKKTLKPIFLYLLNPSSLITNTHHQRPSHHILLVIHHFWMHVLPAGLSPRYWSHRRHLGWIPFRGRTAVNGPVFWLATASTDVIALIAETHVWRWRQAAVDVAGGDGGSFSVADAEVAAICKRLP